IRFASPRAMKPAPAIATRTGRPSLARCFRALSMRIMPSPCVNLARDFREQMRAHSADDFRADLGERCPLAVLVRNHGDGQGPAKTESGVVVPQAAFDTRCVEFADLVARIGV